MRYTITYMIARITGIIIGSTDKCLIVETGGIAYKILVPSEILMRYKNSPEISLWTSHIVREDSQELFGFEQLKDQDLFELLLTVSGIGPRSALGVMNVTTAETIARAVSINDVSYLTKISGIGKKTAEKIILELRDKLPYLDEGDISSHHDVIDALVALGYSESKARETVRTIDGTLNTKDSIREALKLLNN